MRVKIRSLVREHLGREQDEEDEIEPQPPKPQRSIQETIQALQVVIELTEGREDMQVAQLRAMEQVEEQLRLLEVNGRVQSTVDEWIYIIIQDINIFTTTISWRGRNSVVVSRLY